MIIEKFLHACLRVTEGGHRLLIDPGSFCFADGRVRPEDFGPVDVILLTHEHPDHFFPDALRALLAQGQPTILAHAPFAERVRAAGFPCTIIDPGRPMTAASFTIEAFTAAHGSLPIPVPDNVGYLINESLYHPGDSLIFPVGRHVETLALPVAGPWCTVLGAVEAARRFEPTTVFPIHDAIIQPFFLDRLHWMVEQGLRDSGTTFVPVQLGSVAMTA